MSSQSRLWDPSAFHAQDMTANPAAQYITAQRQHLLLRVHSLVNPWNCFACRCSTGYASCKLAFWLA